MTSISDPNSQRNPCCWPLGAPRSSKVSSLPAAQPAGERAVPWCSHDLLKQVDTLRIYRNRHEWSPRAVALCEREGGPKVLGCYESRETVPDDCCKAHIFNSAKSIVRRRALLFAAQAGKGYSPLSSTLFLGSSIQNPTEKIFQ